MICAMSWEENFKEIRQADALLAYAEHKDRPNGTLVEIGYALAMELPVCLVGNFDWASWRHHPSVIHFSTLREAVAQITGESLNAENPLTPPPVIRCRRSPRTSSTSCCAARENASRSPVPTNAQCAASRRVST